MEEVREQVEEEEVREQVEERDHEQVEEGDHEQVEEGAGDYGLGRTVHLIQVLHPLEV